MHIIAWINAYKVGETDGEQVIGMETDGQIRISTVEGTEDFNKSMNECIVEISTYDFPIPGSRVFVSAKDLLKAAELCVRGVKQ